MGKHDIDIQEKIGQSAFESMYHIFDNDYDIKVAYRGSVNWYRHWSTGVQDICDEKRRRSRMTIFKNLWTITTKTSPSPHPTYTVPGSL
jgi:hypothetical protein